MKKKNLFLIGILLLVLFSIFQLTKRREPEFIPLPLLSGKINSRSSFFREVVLIKNPPKDKVILDSLKLIYLRKHGIDLCSLGVKKTIYSLAFYKKTCCTSYFITHPEDHTGFSSDILAEDCEDDDLDMFYYQRSEKNPNIWYSSYPKDFKDTVFCNCNTVSDTLSLW
ncbi:hypothetical protein DMA11_02120 [Marinilabiliaceae bacterium JC017]|nr:hypothetical protein DMA11_02120 [Marinilabiliaceae bacterium JC017]